MAEKQGIDLMRDFRSRSDMTEAEALALGRQVSKALSAKYRGDVSRNITSDEK